MTSSMLAAVLHGTKDLRVESRPRPEATPGSVVLRVRRAGVCGSDVHYFNEGRCGSFAVTAPFIIGHEFSAEVVAVGDGVRNLAIGQHVVANPAWQCGQCDYCRAGRGNLCRNVRMLGSASTQPHTDGAFCEYLRLTADQCYPIPEKMDLGIAALMEPFAVGMHALSCAGSVVGKRVLVTGGGAIGLVTAIAARAVGATTVAVSDPVEERRNMALTVGADAALDPTAPDYQDQVTKLTDDGFDVVLEASGAPPALKGAFTTTRRGGTIVQIGTISVPEVALPVNLIMVRELHIVGSFRYGNVWPAAVRLVSSGRVDLKPLITQVLPLRQAAEAVALAGSRSGVVKVQLDFT